MSEINPDDIHIDWHNAAEHVLKGKLRSTVTFTEFRHLMGAERTNYINDEEMLALYRLHTHDPIIMTETPDWSVHAAMPTCHPRCDLKGQDHPGSREYRCIDADGNTLPFPGEGWGDDDPDWVPGTKAEMIRELAERNGLDYFQVPLAATTKPEDLFGIYRPADDGTMQFLSTAKRVERETKPPLSRRAKKALRRAKRRFRRHA